MLAPVGGIPHAWPSTMPLGWQSTLTVACKDRQTTKKHQQQQQRQRQTSRSSTPVRQPGHHCSNAKPKYYNQTRTWRALKRWLPDLTSTVRSCGFDLFSHTKQGAPKQNRVVFFFSRLTKSTHRSSTVCSLMNISSCGGEHPSVIPSSFNIP